MADNLISTSKYDIYSKLMTIAQKYNPNFNNEDFLKIGLFGYITESMAMIARDSSLHKTMLYNESFLNTAVMPKSVYNWAKMFNINITSSTPAYADILVTIDTDNIRSPYLKNYFGLNEDKYGPEVSNMDRNILILDRESPFVAGEFYFMLEKSIIIYRSNDDSNVYIVKYCSSEPVTTTFHNLDSYFIKNTISKSSGKTYLSFIVRAYQYQVTQVTKQITSASFLDTKIHSFNFSDQYVTSHLFYKKGSSDLMEIPLRFSNIVTTAAEEEETTFAYYSLVDEKTIQINFSSAAGHFMPAANSTLYMDIYSSKGSIGNINYSGNVIFRLKDETLRNLPITATFSSGVAIGGIDSPSINKIKSKVINAISTRDVIVTETDLNNYFLIITALLETINDGKITFIKKRDDILRRVFSAYVLLRDGLDMDGAVATSNYISKPIPTNTLTADFEISNTISKPFGSIIARKSDNVNAYEYLSEDPGDDDYYIIPFYTRIVLSPFKKVKYIYNLTDDSSNLTYKVVSRTSGERYIIPSTVDVYRGLSGIVADDKYRITFNFITNFNMKNDVLTTDEFVLSFYRKGNNTVPIAPISILNSDTENVEIISTENEENPGIFDSSISFYIAAKNGSLSGDEFNFTDPTASTDYGTNINLVYDATSIILPEDVRIAIKLNSITNSSLNMEFISGGYLSLFRNLDELMFSDITMNYNDAGWVEVEELDITTGDEDPTTEDPNPSTDRLYYDTTNKKLYEYNTTWAEVSQIEDVLTISESDVTSETAPGKSDELYYYINTIDSTIKVYTYVDSEYVSSVTIKDIPVVHASFFNSESNQTKFIKQLFVYIDMLKENLGKLETNTFFDLKFYNTYGDSQYYNTLKTNIQLEMNIYVVEWTQELETSIKDYIRLLVDSSNEQESLKISEIIKNVKVQFGDAIDHIDFFGLNGTFNQYIEQTSTIRRSLFPPEYLNIDAEHLTDNSIQVLEI